MTEVVFRTYRDGQVIALFPKEIWDQEKNCASYMRLGQHGGANYNHVVASTRPSSRNEIAVLEAELKSIGYSDLKIYRRKPPERRKSKWAI